MVPALLGFCKPLGNIFFPFLQQVKNIFFKILFVLLGFFSSDMRLQEFFFQNHHPPPPHPPPPILNPLKSKVQWSAPWRLCGHILAVAVTHNALLNMLPNQAAKPCVHIGFEVADRMKSNEHYEQHKIKT